MEHIFMTHSLNRVWCPKHHCEVFYDCGHEIKNISVVYPMSHRLKYFSEQILISSPVNSQQNTASSQPVLGGSGQFTAKHPPAD